MTTRKRLLAVSAMTVLLSACGGGGDDDTPVPPPPPPPASGNVPTISQSVKDAAAAISADPKIRQLVAEWQTDADAQYRYDSHMELVRIASPSRYEFRRAQAIRQRLIDEWGFDEAEVVTREDGQLPGAGLQLVDGLPVYNVCAQIKGSYAGSQGAQAYKGQYPKVLIEGHIDTVYPAELPPESNPFEPIKLQSMAEAIVGTPEALAALPNALSFDGNGRIVRDAFYTQAYRRFDTADAATAAGALRHYVPGYSDAMGNAVGAFHIARMLKKYNIQPVYDIWVCGTAGEEGKGNLAGMKQLYGYNQDTGKGNNALNFVTNFSIDGGSGTINFIGSYRFEMKFKAPAEAAQGGATAPSALNAAAMAAARIADIKTPWDSDAKALKTTYTVGTMACEAPLPNGVTPSCTMQVDMRSPRLEPLNEIRSRIEPLFAAGMAQENARFGAAEGSAQAVSMELVWFGDRPPHERTDLSDVSIQSAWQAAETVGVDKRTELSLAASSLNDNVPAAIGVPTINLNISTNAAGGGTHAFYEWGVPGNANTEGLRLYRVMMAALIAAGVHTSDGKRIAPAAGPLGARTTEDQY
ncbi:peptidase M20 [Comamonas serinivorans]|uniref:peptidase M20 n=1 Tax=Comamonas serinivorans TaxID=1082851 RepID=UPI001F20B5B5|nr:peptidase M20 [Comamonas serinivorans]